MQTLITKPFQNYFLVYQSSFHYTNLNMLYSKGSPLSDQLFIRQTAQSQNQNSQLYCLEIDGNFILKITVQRRGLSLSFKGAIYHKNGFYLKVSKSFWKIVYNQRKLQNVSFVFLFDCQTNSPEILSKLSLVKSIFSNSGKLYSKTCKKMLQESRNFIKNCYHYGLISLSNRFFFNSFLQQSRLRKKIILIRSSAQFSKQGCKQEDQRQILEIQQKLDENKSPIQSCQIQFIDKTFPILNIPHKLQAGEKKYKRHDCLKVKQGINRGGFFQIETKLCKILLNYQNFDKNKKFQNQDQEKKNLRSLNNNSNEKKDQIIDVLAIKSLKQDKIAQEINHLRISKEFAIIKQIKNTSHLLRYYQNVSEQSKLHINSQKKQLIKFFRSYITQTTGPISQIGIFDNQNLIEALKKEALMQFHPHTMSNLIQKPCLSLDQTVQTCQQLIQSILILHENYVIHRDIKPDNFLIDFSSNKTKFNLKVIDFCESAIYTEEKRKFQVEEIEKIIVQYAFQRHNALLYGSTLLYSPLECQMYRQKRTQKGVNSFKIDSWSIGMVLPEICTGKKLLNLHQPYLNDIAKLIKQNGIQIYRSKIPKKGFQLIEQIINYLSVNNVIQNQERRMSVKNIQKCFTEAKLNFDKLNTSIKQVRKNSLLNQRLKQISKLKL